MKVTLQNNHDPCIMCDPFVGSTWLIEDPARPLLPLHFECRCHFIPAADDAELTRPSWTNIPAESHTKWIQWVAYLLRAGAELPPFFEPLRPAAEQYNEERMKNQATYNGRILLKTVNSIPNQFLARLVRAGRIRNADNSPGKYTITPEAIQTAVADGYFNGLAIFVDHPENGRNNSLRALIGVTHSARYNPETQSADAIIRLYTGPDHPLANTISHALRAIQDDAQNGIDPPDIGLSLVFYPVLDGDTVIQFRKIDSVDLVFIPAADGRIIQALSATKGENPMSEETTPVTAAATVTPNPPASSPPDPAPAQKAIKGWQDAMMTTAVPALLAAANLPEPSRQRLAKQRYNSPEELEVAIQDERDYLASLVEEKVIQVGGIAPRGSISHMQTGLDVAKNAVAWLFGVDGAELPPPSLRAVDVFYTMLTGDYEFHGREYPDRIAFSGATVGALPSMAANAMNKVVTAQFSELAHYRWFERIVQVEPNDGSVNAMQWITFGGIDNLPVVTEKAAYEELDVADAGESNAFVKRGGYIGITLEMIRNSQIQRIRAVPRALAIAAVRTRSTAVSSIFTSNSGVGPTLTQDSTALFHTDHSNLATTALGTDATAWRAARSECYRHTEVGSGKAIAVFPRYWIGPAELYDTALSVFGYGEGMPTTYSPEAQGRGFADPRPIPIVSPDFTDANDWAYIVDPVVYPVIQMSYAQAPGGGVHPAPELWSAVSETGGLLFTNDVLAVKVRDWFAVGVNGPRGIGKRNVT